MELTPEAEAWYSRNGMLERMREWVRSGDPARVGIALERWKFPPPARPALSPEPAPALSPELEAVLVPKPYEALGWLRRYAAQGRDPEADVRSFLDPGPVPAPFGPPVVGWIHVGMLGGWEGILKELFSAVERSGLAAASARVFVGVSEDQGNDLSWFPDWAEVVHREPWKPGRSAGENSTIRRIPAWAGSAPRSRVWYLHTKGARHRSDPAGEPDPHYQAVLAWRDYLVFWNVLRWRDSAAALDGVDATGVDYHDAEEPFMKSAWYCEDTGKGFVGNFWWADSTYLAGLDPTKLGDGSGERDRWHAEWRFVGQNEPRVRSFHQCGINLYTERYDRFRYDPDQASPEPPLPGWLTAVGSAVGSAVGLVRAVASGSGLTVPDDVVQARLAVCHQCPTGRFRPSDGRCSVCSCFMSVKSWAAGQSCPEGHW
jgi:hypothetical protein